MFGIFKILSTMTDQSITIIRNLLIGAKKAYYEDKGYKSLMDVINIMSLEYALNEFEELITKTTNDEKGEYRKEGA